jgi:4-coumarate--CoA ligase
MDATIIGVEGEVIEILRAYVVAEETQLSADEIHKFVNSAVARYKQLRGGMLFIDEILKAASGKILQKDLLQLAARTRSKL